MLRRTVSDPMFPEAPAIGASLFWDTKAMLLRAEYSDSLGMPRITRLSEARAVARKRTVVTQDDVLESVGDLLLGVRRPVGVRDGQVRSTKGRPSSITS